MYLPRHFQVAELPRLHALIRDNALATMVCMAGGRLEANHVPVVLDDDGGNGRVRFHLARANPAAAALDGTCEALLVFQGAEAYVSPDWYASTNRVPTWNYAAVHVHGVPVPTDDADLHALLVDLSADQERRLAKRPWTVDKLEEDLYARMRGAVVGFSMPIDAIEGKWKMDQHRQQEDRRAVVAALSALDGDGPAAVAAAMTALVPPAEEPSE
jgi:transcriptional regulator